MHIYRFFQPHHNPRLLKRPLRQLEISELEQAASELRKAIERAKQRTDANPTPPIMGEHFTDILKAIRFVEHSLQTLCDGHQGDASTILLDMIQERRELSGWDTWTSLLEEQLVTSERRAPAEQIDDYILNELADETPLFSGNSAVLPKKSS